MEDRLTLSQAIAENRLDEFIEQAEREGVGQTTVKNFDIALNKVIQQQSEDQT